MKTNYKLICLICCSPATEEQQFCKKCANQHLTPLDEKRKVRYRKYIWPLTLIKGGKDT